MKSLLLVTLIGLLAGAGAGLLRQAGDAPMSAPLPLFVELEGDVPASYGTIGSSQVILIVSQRDVRGCEDLGRQLREFVREEVDPAGLSLDVWVYDDLVGEVSRFLETERIAVGRVTSVDPRNLLGADPPTPAVIVRTPGAGYVGVGYANRTKLVRTAAFADRIDIDEILGM